MFKFFCVILVMSSPLCAYTFANYFNMRTESKNGITIKVATVDVDGEYFKTYLEVKMESPRSACAMIAYGAITQATWIDSNVAAVTLSTHGSLVTVSDMIGDEGANSVKTLSKNQDITLAAKGLDPSLTYKDGIWKIELMRPYKKSENGINYDVQPPTSSEWTPVAFNIFENMCPTSTFSYHIASPIVGGWSIYILKPTRSNSAYILLPMLVSVLFVLLLY